MFIRMATLQNIKKMMTVGKVWRNMTFVHCWWDCENGGIASGEKSIKCSQKNRTTKWSSSYTSGQISKRIFTRDICRFVISKKDLASGPENRIDHSRAFVYQSFITVWKATEKSSDIDIRRGTKSAPIASLSEGAIYFFNWLLQ